MQAEIADVITEARALEEAGEALARELEEKAQHQGLVAAEADAEAKRLKRDANHEMRRLWGLANGKIREAMKAESAAARAEKAVVNASSTSIAEEPVVGVEEEVRRLRVPVAAPRAQGAEVAELRRLTRLATEARAETQRLREAAAQKEAEADEADAKIARLNDMAAEGDEDYLELTDTEELSLQPLRQDEVGRLMRHAARARAEAREFRILQRAKRKQLLDAFDEKKTEAKRAASVAASAHATAPEVRRRAEWDAADLVRRQQAEELPLDLEKFRIGQTVKGVIFKVHSDGAVVDIDQDVKAWLPATNILKDHSWMKNARAYLTKGQQINVWIEGEPGNLVTVSMVDPKQQRKFDRDHRPSEEDLLPFVELPRDAYHKGMVTHMLKDGAMVEVTTQAGLKAEGFLSKYAVTMQTPEFFDASDVLQIGQRLQVRVSNTEPTLGFLHLSMLEPDLDGMTAEELWDCRREMFIAQMVDKKGKPLADSKVSFRLKTLQWNFKEYRTLELSKGDKERRRKEIGRQMEYNRVTPAARDDDRYIFGEGGDEEEEKPRMVTDEDRRKVVRKKAAGSRQRRERAWIENI